MEQNATKHNKMRQKYYKNTKQTTPCDKMRQKQQQQTNAQKCDTMQQNTIK